MTLYRPEFETEPRTTMASPTSNSRRDISLAEFGRDVARRRAEVGDFSVPRNSGTRRTPSKVALLPAIKDAGGTW